MHRSILAACLVLFASVASSQTTTRVKLGDLGITTTPTRIYASPNSRSRIFYRVPVKKYLVIKAAPTAGWFAVLMMDGTLGFVPSKAVNKLALAAYQSQNYTPREKYAMTQGDTASRSGIANYALNFVGTPYKWGGNDEQSGIDCSGFVKKMYGKIGLDLPRTAAQQALVGQPIHRLEDLRKGDRLYFWETKRGMIGHTGIYEGGGYFVHSSHGHHGVATDYLTPSWRRILVAARR